MLYIHMFICLFSVSPLQHEPHGDSNCVVLTAGFLVPSSVSGIQDKQVKFLLNACEFVTSLLCICDSTQWCSWKLFIYYRSYCISETSLGLKSHWCSDWEGLTHQGIELCSVSLTTPKCKAIIDPGWRGSKMAQQFARKVIAWSDNRQVQCFPASASLSPCRILYWVMALSQGQEACLQTNLWQWIVYCF